MITVLITIAKNPTNDYPFAVKVGNSTFMTDCRNTRDAFLFANGVMTGLMHTQVHCTLKWDDRIVKPEVL